MPRRVQRKRTKGWRMPEGATYVGRPTRWGNLWAVGSGHLTATGWLDRPAVGDPEPDERWYELPIEGGLTPAMCVELYRLDLTGQLDDGDEYYDELRDSLDDLRGLDLVCWCPLDQPCHADALLEMANR